MSKTLILLPGFMCDERLFSAQIEAFQKDHNVKVICADPAAQSVEEMARDVLARAPDTFSLLGLSMGAIIAMEVIKIAAGRVERLALFDCNSMPDSAESSMKRKRQIDLVQAGQLANVMQTQHIPNYFTEGTENDSMNQLCQDMANKTGAKAFINHQHALIKRPDQREALQKIKCPTLVACGTQDRPCPPENHELIASLISDAYLKFIPNAGHLPTIEQPEASNIIIKEWLEMHETKMFHNNRNLE